MAVSVAVASMLLAFTIGALGNVVGSAACAPWVDPSVTQHELFHGSLTAGQWTQLA